MLSVPKKMLQKVGKKKNDPFYNEDNYDEF